MDNITYKDNDIEKYRQLRKVAIRHWNVFTFSIGYVFIYPWFNKYNNNLLRSQTKINYSLLSSYIFYKIMLKRVLYIFNYDDYNDFCTHCKKHDIKDELV